MTLNRKVYMRIKRNLNKLHIVAPKMENDCEKWKLNKFKDFCLFKHIFINI